MPDDPDPKPLRILLRNLALTAVLGVGLYILFTVFNDRVLHGLTDPEILLLEAGAVALLAWLVSASVTNAINGVLVRSGRRSHGHVIRLFINLVIAVGAVLALFDLAGVSASSIFLGSAFAGIILGLAAQTVLSNVMAGILLAIADPFRPGDRVSFVSSSYGAIGPSYNHEMMYPSYSGTVEDVGLLYTVLGVDSGGTARVPNSIVLTALILQPRAAQATRVRMTFPLTVPVPTVEAALAEIARDFPVPGGRGSAPRLHVADIAAQSWDAVITVWSPGADDGTVRDQVLRSVLGRIVPAPAAAAPGPAPAKPRPTP